MLNYLRQPYPIETSVPIRIFQVVGLPVCIFSILFFIAPFDLNEIDSASRAKLAFGFALCTFFPMLINLFVLMPQIDERTWTTGKEILFVCWNFFFIAVVNLGYGWYLGFAALTPLSFFYSLVSTVGVGFVPVTLYIIVNQNILLRKYFAEATVVTQRIQVRHVESESPVSNLVVVEAENPANYLSLHPEEILFIAAADNYVEVFHCAPDEAKVRRVLVRTTMKRAEQNLSTRPEFVRVHRGFIANLKRVSGVSGNAQGYRLIFEKTDVSVPVSRTLNGLVEGIG